MVLSIALGLIVGFAGIAAIAWALFPRLFPAVLVPRTPNPAFVPDCTTPNAPSNAVFGPGLTSGVVRAPLVTLAANTTLRITGDLTLISTGDLKIDGSILNGPSPAAGSDFSHNITLISLNGNVLIGANARIGFDNSTVISAAAPAAGANITGAPGKTAGWIKIVSQNGIVANAGQIVGFPGVAGQSATDAQPATAGPMAFFGRGLPASCASGGGGDGGHVLLCALDSIVNDGTVLAGNAGDGGIATSTAGNFADATAVGGPGGGGASIMLRGLANPGPVSVANNGTMAGGIGGFGGGAIAVGGNGKGAATANAGSAGGGGTVEFNSVELAPVGTVHASTGGDGGVASATGGPGRSPLLRGKPGGDATASGGAGGVDGPMGIIPVPPPGPPAAWGPIIVGLPRPTGAGGDASAKPGTGGTGHFGGGSSGSISATGGTGKGGTAATPVVLGPVAPVGGAGGIGPVSTSAGTP